MNYNSYQFLAFFAVAFGVYWLTAKRSLLISNLCVIALGLVFYGWTDYHLCALLSLSATSAYLAGVALSVRRSKLPVVLSVAVNLAALFLFKYYDFFAGSFSAGLKTFGFTVDVPLLNLVLPIGLSFYTFMSISYVVDVYRGLNPERRAHVFFAYLMFFPQLLAGPIGRAGKMIPQFSAKRYFDYDMAVDGCRQFLWGLFMKMVIADTFAIHTDKIFGSVSSLGGITLVWGAVLYAFQIYADFSGYSDMAIGCGKLLGIRLIRNFEYPYFSRSVGEFWRRWHISLSAWFRDYVYIPLGGSRNGISRHILNVWIVFLLSGLWHGAAWTFVIWGGVHALFLSVEVMVKNTGFGSGVHFKGLDLLKLLVVFAEVSLAWVFFRAETFGDAVVYINGIFNGPLFAAPAIGKSAFPWIAVVIFVDWLQRGKGHGLDIAGMNRALRWGVYLALVVLCLSHYVRDAEFIYFSF